MSSLFSLLFQGYIYLDLRGADSASPTTPTGLQAGFTTSSGVITSNDNETDENTERLGRIREVCRRFKVPPEIYNKGRSAAAADSGRVGKFRCHPFFIAKQLRTLFCMVPKTGSTSWKSSLTALIRPLIANSSEISPNRSLGPRQVLPRVCKLNSTAREDMFERYFKFAIVRHPLARLYSAYDNKFRAVEDRQVRYGYHPKNRRNVLRKTQHFYNNSKRIYFARFVKFLTMANPTGYDWHWKPTYMLCNPCLTQFDYIGKLETIERDQGEIFQRLSKYSTVTNAKLPHLNPQRHDGEQWSQTTCSSLGCMSTPVLNEFAKIPREDMSKLLKIYALDFEMYGYQMPAI